jgi:hypothetical protein
MGWCEGTGTRRGVARARVSVLPEGTIVLRTSDDGHRDPRRARPAGSDGDTGIVPLQDLQLSPRDPAGHAVGHEEG